MSGAAQRSEGEEWGKHLRGRANTMRWSVLAVLAALLALAAAQCQPPPPPHATADTALHCRAVGIDLTRLPTLPATLLVLDVSNNKITELPRGALLPATSLHDLNLSLNPLERISAGALGGAALARLWLERCALRRVPYDALRDLRHLHYLSLAGNLLASLDDAALPPLPALHTLVLKRNRITLIAARAFANTPVLRVLRLEENLLSEMPPAIHLLPMLEDFSLASNRVSRVGNGVLTVCQRLVRLELRSNPLEDVHAHALHNLPHLSTLILSEARGLHLLPSLNGSLRLRTLLVMRARLTSLPPSLCASAPQLRLLDARWNQLDRMPDLRECSELRVLDLSWNSISLLDGDALRGLQRLQDLVLQGNHLQRLSADAFTRVPDLLRLDLDSNQIEHIDVETFVPISKLEDLNVGNNVFETLPAIGLQNLLHLKAYNNPNLRHFHPPSRFPRIEVHYNTMWK